MKNLNISRSANTSSCVMYCQSSSSFSADEDEEDDPDDEDDEEEEEDEELDWPELGIG